MKGRLILVKKTTAATKTLAAIFAGLSSAFILSACTVEDPEPVLSPTPTISTGPSPSASSADPQVAANAAEAALSAAYAQLITNVYGDELVIHEGREAYEALIEEQISLEGYGADPAECLTGLDSELLDGQIGALGVHSAEAEGSDSEIRTSSTAILQFPDAEAAAAYVDARRAGAQRCDSYSVDLLEGMNFLVTSKSADFAGIQALEEELRNPPEPEPTPGETGPLAGDSYMTTPTPTEEPVDTAWIDQLVVLMGTGDETLYIDTHSTVVPEDGDSGSAAVGLAGRGVTAIYRQGDVVIATTVDFDPAEAELGRILTEVQAGLADAQLPSPEQE